MCAWVSVLFARTAGEEGEGKGRVCVCMCLLHRALSKPRESGKNGVLASYVCERGKENNVDRMTSPDNPGLNGE